MMGWTDRHARYFLRLISKHTLLYTEMVTTGALLNGESKRFLSYHQSENPLVLQLGGSDPVALAQCTQMAEQFEYDEVNLNVGCPSDRVKSGQFGACLMAKPQLVADCVSAMQAKVDIPVTVKCRIGIDDLDDYAALKNFISIVAESGCSTFIVHARKAWLKGLSPKENREVPPLKYDYVHRLKRECPELEIIINGGIKTLEHAKRQLIDVDGVMLGREAYHNPYILAPVDKEIYLDEQAVIKSRNLIVEELIEYIDIQMSQGTSLHSISRHILGLFQGCRGAKAWRRYLSENSHKEDAGSSVVKAALSKIMD